MTQEVLNNLVKDGLELFQNNNQTELAKFFEYLADKYDLIFYKESYLFEAVFSTTEEEPSQLYTWFPNS